MDGWQRGFVLHARPYSETSLMLDVFTEDQGRLRILAKGARSRRSNLKGCLQPFTPLLLRWSGRGEVKTLRSAEPAALALPFSRIGLYSALYVNELITRVLEPQTAYSSVFLDYLTCLRELAQYPNNPEPALRRFELALLQALGYGIDFVRCAGSGLPVDKQMTYRYREERGFIASLIVDQLSFSGQHLYALAARQFDTADQLKAAKRFTRLALKPYLGGKPLKSRELFRHFAKESKHV
ncbi:MAG: DNA repair protein RecO [Plesiomonas sp.]|uniref:DNA repair protein RecO n=1 Tax=Plesiomonas sp. TaxID=2486279 RepID=UPI003F3CA4B7